MDTLPDWANEIISTYESEAAGCFLIHGNVSDRILTAPQGQALRLGDVIDFIVETLLPRFEVIITYDIGFGLRVERGSEIFSQWPSYIDNPQLPHKPLDAARLLTHYLQYCRNLKILGKAAPKVAVIIKQAHLVCPAIPNMHNYDVSALAAIIRSWADGDQLQKYGQTAFLISESFNHIHPLIREYPKIQYIELPLPRKDEIARTLEHLSISCPTAMHEYKHKTQLIAGRLIGATISSIESLLLRLQYDGESLNDECLYELKKKIVERDCDGLIDFVEPDRNLDDCIGLTEVKQWLRQDIKLWRKNELEAMPMGYLFCGPVGTGKTYLAECLAGEAGVPVVTMKNFREKWIGSTEANLEKIFSLLHALGRCIVFIDEADQALGKRDSNSGDSGVSSRVYSMMAKEMSNTDNRGKIIWVLASSRPDLIEVDLKRPGRVDVKLPLFPSLNPDEGFTLMRALCKRLKLAISKDYIEEIRDMIPTLLTPGAAEAIAVKTYRTHKTSNLSAEEALKKCLESYRPPISLETLKFQIRIAAEEATDSGFIPKEISDIIDH